MILKFYKGSSDAAFCPLSDSKQVLESVTVSDLAAVPQHGDLVQFSRCPEQRFQVVRAEWYYWQQPMPADSNVVYICVREFYN